jgi:hypothetical protein
MLTSSCLVEAEVERLCLHSMTNSPITRSRPVMGAVPVVSDKYVDIWWYHDVYCFDRELRQITRTAY